MSMNTKEDTRKTLTQSAIMRLGFTKKMIETLLPEPAKREKNPYYRNAAPIKLWYEDDIRAIMESPEYQECVEKSANRKAGAKKAVATKINKCRTIMNDIADLISVEVVPNDKLIDDAIAAKNAWYAQMSSYYLCDCGYADKSNPEYVARIVVNYVRHNLTTYDKSLYELPLRGTPSRRDIYVEFFDIVLDKIAAAYPQYADECERQKQRKQNYAIA